MAVPNPFEPKVRQYLTIPLMEPCTQYCHIVSLSLPGGPETLSLVGELRSYPERSNERLKDGKGIIGET